MTDELQTTHRALRLRFYVKCDRCSERGKLRAERCRACLGLGHVLNRAGERRFQRLQDAYREHLMSWGWLLLTSCLPR